MMHFSGNPRNQRPRGPVGNICLSTEGYASVLAKNRAHDRKLHNYQADADVLRDRKPRWAWLEDRIALTLARGVGCMVALFEK